MSDLAIKVQHLSKQYRLGQVGTGTLKHDLNRLWYSVRGKEDPYLKIGQTNDRTTVGQTDYAWALKDINFEVKKGEALGIIGRNGAGKSTLLKILSKITSPTTGEININGRIASLLEVGTGFHPDLTGRENIFMNGSILGMRKWEIQSKFDEIVDFAGVAAYVDTPVKRYSSGMKVRLGFAVAAYLEPEILVVDEVLAVGDSEFQKKCIGKMKDVSNNQGRTVLFVSHNLGAVSSLCQTGILLHNGNLIHASEIESVLAKYSSIAITQIKSLIEIKFDGSLRNHLNFTDVRINDKSPFNESIHLSPSSRIMIEVDSVSNCKEPFRITISFYKEGIRLFSLHDTKQCVFHKGKLMSIFQIPSYFLRQGIYTVALGAYTTKDEWLWNDNVFNFEILSVFDEGNDKRDFGLINLNAVSTTNRISI
jgi:lipopolysaccharide transport system ATP-binding protein